MKNDYDYVMDQAKKDFGILKNGPMSNECHPMRSMKI